MATRKSVTKSKQKPVKAKVSKPTPAKKTANTQAPESSAEAKNVRAAATAPVKQKIKLVCDSFTMSKSEYLSLSDLKLRSVRLGVPAKKSEIVRAGIAVLSKMSDTGFAAVLDAIPSLKVAKPKDSKKSATKKAAKKT